MCEMVACEDGETGLVYILSRISLRDPNRGFWSSNVFRYACCLHVTVVFDTFYIHDLLSIIILLAMPINAGVTENHSHRSSLKHLLDDERFKSQ